MADEIDELEEFEQEEEVSPLLTLLEDEHEEEVDEADLELGDIENASEEALREKLNFIKDTVKIRNGTIKRMQKEISDLKNGSSTQLTPELVQALVKGQGSSSEEPEGIDIDKLKERIDEDPTNIVEILVDMIAASENKTAQVLKARDSYLEGLTKKAPNPQVKAIMEKMKGMDRYAQFDDDALQIIAEDLLPRKGSRPPAGTGGKGVRTAPKKESTEDERNAKYKSELEQMGL